MVNSMQTLISAMSKSLKLPVARTAGVGAKKTKNARNNARKVRRLVQSKAIARGPARRQARKNSKKFLAQ